jgi:hypothetical protein
MRPRYGDDRERIACRKRRAPRITHWPKMEAQGIVIVVFSMSAMLSVAARKTSDAQKKELGT